MKEEGLRIRGEAHGSYLIKGRRIKD